MKLSTVVSYDRSSFDLDLSAHRASGSDGEFVSDADINEPVSDLLRDFRKGVTRIDTPPVAWMMKV